MTEREIMWRLRPPWPGTAHPLTEWCAELIAARDWSVRYGPEYAAFSKATPRAIEVPGSLVSDEDIAKLLHECGHLLDPRARPRKPIEDWEPMDRHISIPSECAAWLFAADLAGRRWTDAMQTTLEACLRSYDAVYVQPCSAHRRLVVDTITYTQARLRRRGVVSLRHNGGAPPVAVPASIRSLVDDVITTRLETAWPR